MSRKVKHVEVAVEPVVEQSELATVSEAVEPVETVEVMEMSQESIDKENRIVDLESQIIKVGELLAELKKEYRTLTKPVKTDGPSKMELATQLWKDNPGLARKVYVEKFMSELGLTLAGSRTYIQLIMTKNK